MTYRILFGESDLVSRWIAAQIKDAPDLTGAVAFGAVREDMLIGGIAFTEHRGTEVRVTIAGYGSWLTRRLLRAGCAYAFEDLGCRRMTAIIKRTNRASRTVCERIGFKLEGTHRQAYEDGGTALSYGMVRDECKWLKGSDRG
ncbi:GNAT family N-acetyltransferase [Aureimonas sp. N4]|uniref:GNAT family N-acetyltransferase n=1 Tax=Aureimonas sp. N4 TaxID=1638165 RepID=UPI00078404D3|nr:GNAT family protein [Aureimonas sp. N4]